LPKREDKVYVKKIKKMEGKMKMKFERLWIKILFVCMSLVVLALQGCGGGGGSDGLAIPSTGVSGIVSDAVTGLPIEGVAYRYRTRQAIINGTDAVVLHDPLPMITDILFNIASVISCNV
jgi:hypothetical protein